MTLPAVNPQIVFQGTAGGTLGPFSLIKSGTPIRFRQNSDIQVFRYSSATDTTPVQLTEGTDYTLTGGPDAGSLTLTAPQTGLLTAERLRVFRKNTISQTLDLLIGGDFSSSDIETRFDIIYEILQELLRGVENAWRFPGLEVDTLPGSVPLDAIIGKLVYIGGSASAPVYQTIDNPENITGNLSIVAGSISEINVVATDLSGANTIGTVAGNLANINLVASNITAVNTVATNMSELLDIHTNLAALLAISSPTAGDGIDITSGTISLDFSGLTSEASGSVAGSDTIAIQKIGGDIRSLTMTALISYLSNNGLGGGGGGGGATNISISRTATTVTVQSSSGTDDDIPAATPSLAGVMSAADKTKLDGTATAWNRREIALADTPVTVADYDWLVFDCSDVGQIVCNLPAVSGANQIRISSGATAETNPPRLDGSGSETVLGQDPLDINQNAWEYTLTAKTGGWE